MGAIEVDRRQVPRFATQLDVTVYRGNIPISGKVVQLSQRGCLVRPPLPDDIGPEVRLSLRLGEDSASVNCKGEVIYTAADRGTGIAFTEISQYHRELIAKYLREQAGREKGVAG